MSGPRDPLLHKSVEVTDEMAPTFGRFGVVEAVFDPTRPSYVVRFHDAKKGHVSGSAVMSAMQFRLVPAPLFVVDGGRFTQAEMLAANADDEDVREWLRVAAVGDRFPAFNECRRLA